MTVREFGCIIVKEERLIAEKLEEQKIVEYQRMKEQKAKAREERLAVVFSCCYSRLDRRVGS